MNVKCVTIGKRCEIAGNPVRESSFNMTREGGGVGIWSYWNSKLENFSSPPHDREFCYSFDYICKPCDICMMSCVGSEVHKFSEPPLLAQQFFQSKPPFRVCNNFRSPPPSITAPPPPVVILNEHSLTGATCKCVTTSRYKGGGKNATGHWIKPMPIAQPDNAKKARESRIKPSNHCKRHGRTSS